MLRVCRSPKIVSKKKPSSPVARHRRHPASTHAILRSEADLANVSDNLFPGILKTARMGYDGKGQVRVKNIDELRAAFTQLKGVVCVLEKMLPLA